MRWIQIILPLFCLLTLSGHPHGATAFEMTLAGEDYSLSPPAGFVETSLDFPRVFQWGQKAVGPGRTLEQFYLSKQSVERYRQGERLVVNEHALLATIQKLGGKVPTPGYIYIQRYLKRYYTPRIKQNKDAVERLLYDIGDGQVDNTVLRKRLNTGEQLPVQLIKNGEHLLTLVGVRRALSRPLGQGQDALLTCAFRLQRVKKNLFDLRLCRTYRNRDDLNEVSQQLDTWATHIVEANR